MLQLREHKPLLKILPIPQGDGKSEKGKGKGGLQGVCFKCEEFGHPALECTKQVSKGKSTGKGKTKGKGVWQVDGEEDDCPLEQPEDEEQGGIGAVEEWKQITIRAKRFQQKIYSIGRPGEVCAVSEVKGWEEVRAHVDAGAIDTVGPKEIAKAFKMNENAMSKKGLGHLAANGSKIKNYGEKGKWDTQSQETG